MSAFALITDDLVVRDLDCKLRDVVYVKSIAAAYDGLCCLFSEGGGAVQLVAPRGREAELDLLVNDLEREFRGHDETTDASLNLIQDPLR
jgi:hypothetical protein